MGSKRVLGLVLSVIFMEFLIMIGSSQAYKFNVGGKDGWVLNPSENFTRWAERNRFQVNDTLFFKYKKGSDSVLVLTKEDYLACNTQKPIMSLTDGDSVFTLNRSGAFYFASGNGDNCRKGQKLVLVVLAVRDRPHLPPPPPPRSPSPVAPPPSAGGPTSPALAPGPRALSPVPSGNRPQKSSVPAGFGVSVWLVLFVSVGVTVVFG
ncbi:early nodulin-like protein 1 [Ziziphus jujuba]|uniref:Early nodulin-like protein 1 n=1 Tax=Ziziphus jujuba TaxID=326968 RepID=A0A6P3ZQM5_ZIZJJ|nr:early nodulin-like protein 1 [Ziziphus jujuba]